MKKKLISFVLTLCTVIAILPTLSTTAAAESYYVLWPVTRNYRISQYYHNGHYALDIAAPAGTPIIATVGGYVEQLYTCNIDHSKQISNPPSCCHGFGFGLVIQGFDGRRYQYAHMLAGSIPADLISQFRAGYGYAVQPGQQIGAVGTTGTSLGNHLHFQITTAAAGTNGQWYPPYTVNPEPGSLNYTYISDPIPYTPVNLGDHFYAAIGRADYANELFGVPNSLEDITSVTAQANQSPQQRWEFIRQDDNSYKIVSTHSNRLLTVENGEYAQGTRAILAEDANSDNQRWYIHEFLGTYKLAAKSTNRALTLYPADQQICGKLFHFGGSDEQRLNIHIHHYEAISVPSECLQGGYTRHQCTDCDDYYITNDGEAIGHQWEIIRTTPATCQELGTMYYACAVCGETKTEQSEEIWSEWMDAIPEDISQDRIESKVQYRYREQESEWGNAQSMTQDCVLTWRDGFDPNNSYYTQYHKTPMVTGETEEQRVTVVSEDTIGYIYYHWCRNQRNDGPHNRFINDFYSDTYWAFHAFFSPDAAGHTDAAGTYVEDAFYFYNRECCGDTYWYFQIPVVRQSCTVEEKVSDGDAWGEWSVWIDDEIDSFEGRQIEKRTVYRYVTVGLGDHSWDNGTCIHCGKTAAVTPIPTSTPTPKPTYTPVPTPTPSPVENPFTDVCETDWFYTSVMWAKESNVTGGTSPTTFSPDAGCTRAQVVTFLWAANGKPEPSAVKNQFTDVSESDWFYKPVLWAVEQGITKGVSPTAFGPEQTCTRAQIVTFLYAAKGKPTITGSSPFTDTADTDWFAAPVIWAKEHDVTGGISATEFGPDQVCTRAQVVTFLSKVYGKNTGHIPLPSLKPIPIPTPIPVPVPSMIPVPVPITPKPVIK